MKKLKQNTWGACQVSTTLLPKNHYCQMKKPKQNTWGACQVNTTLVPNTNEKTQTNTGGMPRLKPKQTLGGMLGHYENQS